MLLHHPWPANCSDRNILPKHHPIAGGPESWLTDNIFEEYGLWGLSFDFFVDWSKNPPPLGNRLWVKRFVDPGHHPWPDDDSSAILAAIQAVDGVDKVQMLVRFTAKHGLLLQYMLFKDTEDWQNNNAPLLAVTLFEQEGEVKARSVSVSLGQVKQGIKAMSGGSVHVGSKGLTLGTSNLECTLSHTDSAWPGDVDLLLVRSDGEPVAMLEYKKHTLWEPISGQKLSNYYPGKDSRKYNRRAVLRDSLGKDLAFIVVYYPTWEKLSKCKLERVVGRYGDLKAVEERVGMLPRREDPGGHRRVFQAILELANISLDHLGNM